MKLLQGGAAKSGNFWLYKIIDHIFKSAGIACKSFVQNHPVFKKAKYWELSYPEQASIDMLDIENKGCFWRISSAVRESIADIDKYIQATSHVWTHSRICDRSLTVYPKFDKIVYIIRDPRDRILSEAKFAFSPYMKKYFPSTDSSPEEYLNNHFSESMDRWRWHVYDHLRYAKDLNMHIVFYERLLKDFDNEFQRLLTYLGIELSDEEKERIKNAVDFSTMKRQNGNHLKKKHYGSWEEVLTDRQKQLAEEINKNLLQILNYPTEKFVPGLLPDLPKGLSKDFMEQRLDEIGRFYCQENEVITTQN